MEIHFRAVERVDNVKMLLPKATRYSRLAFLFLGLAFSVFVFAWGLQYKLSLYDPPQAVSHQIPEAKLLSKNEQSMIAKSPLLDTSRASARAMQLILPSVFLLISLALNLLNAPIFAEKERDTQRSRQFRRFRFLSAFFFRPPPALA